MEKKEKENNKKQEFKGRNLEEVISQAEHTLKLPRSKFYYEVVTEKTKLFGMKNKEIVIRAWPKDDLEENSVAKFLNKLLNLFPLELTYQIKQRDEMIFFIFDGQDKYLLLRKEGALLLALQHLLNKISPQKVQIDCDFFRKRKERELRQYVQNIARQVHETGKDEVLDLMNPYERRIVHIAVNQIPGITTESIGNGFWKKVKIYPSKEQSEST